MRALIIREEKHRASLFVKLVVVPLCAIALLFIFVGVYSFAGANRIMRLPPETSEGFPANILPTYSNASFTSLDGLTKLEGWFFRTAEAPESTVIMVHGYGRNRLQFGSDTVRIYDFFLEEGYNVLSFDLRHSGGSGGKISTFGHSEWQDVLGAISYVRRTASTTDVILYGFGSGCAASLIAYERLPEPDSDPDELAYNIKVLGYDRSYVKAFILDCPLVTSDDYISAVCNDKLFLGGKLGRYTVPYAVRLSSGIEKKYNLAAILARTNLPVHLFSGNYTDEAMMHQSETTVSERLRIFPGKTTVYEIDNNGGEITPYSDILYDPSGYTDSLSEFIDLFFPS